MTTINFLVETIQCKQFRSIYLKNKTFFLEFVSAFFKSALHFVHFQKNMTLIAYELPTPENVVR